MTSNNLWKDLDIVKPFKTFLVYFLIIAGFITFASFYLPLFSDKIDSLSKYKVLENFNLEFRYFIILITLLFFILIYLFIFFRHNLLKYRGIETGVIDPNYDNDGKTINMGNLRCVFYSNLGASYKISKVLNKEHIRLEGYCKITNISDLKVFISSIRFKGNFAGDFYVRDSGGEGYINPNKVTNVNFWGYVDISLFKPKQDIITDVIVTDNFAVDYILRNIRFRYLPNEEVNK